MMDPSYEIRPLPTLIPIPDDFELEGGTYQEKDHPFPEIEPPLVTVDAVRISDTSDTIIFGSMVLGADQHSILLVPRHHERMRVTLQVVSESNAPVVWLGAGYDVRAGNGWQIGTTDPIVLGTEAAVYAATGPGTGTVHVQWAIELRSRR